MMEVSAGNSTNESVTEFVSKDDMMSPEVPSIAIFNISVTLSCIAVIGNALVIYAYLRSKDVQSLPFNVYIFHLSIADMIVGCFILPIEAIEYLRGGWELSWILRSFILQFSTTPTVMSLLIIILMSCDRYFLVSNPLKYNLRRTKPANIKLLAATWAVAVIYSLLIVTVANLTIISRVPQSYTRTLIYTLFQSICNFLLPFLVLLLINLLVLIKLRRQVKWSNDNRNQMYVKQKENGDKNFQQSSEGFTTLTIESNKQKSNQAVRVSAAPVNGKEPNITKAVKKLLLIVVVFSVCWLPLPVIFATSLIVPIDTKHGYLDEVALIFLYGNSAVNPAIYAAVCSRYRKSLREIINKVFCRTM